MIVDCVYCCDCFNRVNSLFYKSVLMVLLPRQTFPAAGIIDRCLYSNDDSKFSSVTNVMSFIDNFYVTRLLLLSMQV